MRTATSACQRMLRSLLIVAVACSACARALRTGSRSAAGFLVGGTVEHVREPLGIATLHPRFSWQVTPPAGHPRRNLSQVGYVLRVSSTASTAGPADVCDSGPVAAAGSSLVSCAPARGSAGSGFPLSPGQLYYWTVTATLSDGSVVAMPTSRFSTGLQTRADWHPAAQFVGLPASAPPAPPATAPQDSGRRPHQHPRSPHPPSVVCPWLRSATFGVSRATAAALSGGAGAALLTVASIGWHEVYLNGRRLEEASVLIPSVSDLHHRVLSHQYDASAYLVEGSNTLAFWAAPGWSQLTWSSHVAGGAGTSFNVSAAPLVMAQLTACTGPGLGCDLLVATNATGWRARASSIEHTGGWEWGNYGGEKIDWGQDVPGWSTTSPTSAAAGWVGAAAVPVDKAVTPESLEAMAVVEILPATGIAACAGQPAGSCFVVSFPRLFNGFFTAASLPGLGPGQAVSLTYSANCLTPCPRVADPHMPCAPPTSGPGVCTSAATEWHAVDTLVAGPAAGARADGAALFANKFNWHTFQFVVIQVTAGPASLRLSAADLGKFTGQRITNNQVGVCPV